MTMVDTNPPEVSEAKHVEVLTSAGSGAVIGYRLQGGRAGPSVLVAGHNPFAEGIYDRLMALPTLPWLRGSLCLIILETFDNEACPDSLLTDPSDKFDEVLFLPYSPETENGPEMIKEGYWMVLRLCAQLGMIDGRGVSSARNANS